jgi:hypothetical protein
MSYILLNVEVAIVRDGEPFGHFWTDVFVDTCSRPARRYTYGRAYRTESDISWYLEPRETKAWHELLIFPEDQEKRPGFKLTGEEAKLARARLIARAEQKVIEAENELRRLVA